MLTRDIHNNKETKEIALYELKVSIELARKDQDRLLCLIVGYGSKGKTHIIKTSILEELEVLKEKNQVKEYIIGSDLDIFNTNYQKLKNKNRIPENEKKHKNPGAIYIIL